MPNTRTDSEADNARVLLQLISDLCAELRSQALVEPVTLDSTLERDLGLDSLSRAELFSRVEGRFRVSLAEQAFADAETPRDLLRAITQAAAAAGAAAPTAAAFKAKTQRQQDVVDPAPATARTLVDILAWHVERHPGRVHIQFYSDDSTGETLTYGQLWRGARAVAAGLQRRGLNPGQTVILMLPTGTAYFCSFFGILLCAAIPVPIYPPARRSQLEDHVRRQTDILNNCQASMLITAEDSKALARLLQAQVASLRHVVTIASLQQAGTDPAPVELNASDIAFIQYTSGSTGNPKGVILTHPNLLGNIRAFGRVMDASSRDVFVSWLPLYHDMGLIGAWLGSLYYGALLVSMSPIAFLGRPQRWLWAIHRYGGTLSAAPNFAYELCLGKIPDEALQQLDLSSWRLALNGAEAVSPHTVRAFCRRFEPFGFRAKAMYPVYGLAENSVGLAFPDPDSGPRIDRIRRDLLMREGRALPAGTDDDQVQEFVCCGHALPGHEIRIVDDAGRELPDRYQGRLQFKGVSATSGYYRNAVKTRELFCGDWLETGDLAYRADGETYITGRIKDLIIRAGRNIYPEELENAVGDIPNVRKGRVAAFGLPDEESGTERLLIMAETRISEPAAREKLQRQVMETVTHILGEPPDDVILAAPGCLLKTSSGKIRRAACRELYRQGAGQSQAALWVQTGRLLFSSVRPQLRRLRRTALNHLFAGYGVLLFSGLGLIALLSTLLLPSYPQRWRTLGRLARLWAKLTATPLHITGIERLPVRSPCIYVANHASYLDVFVLTAALPHPVSFIAKQELQANPLLRRALDRLQTQYVHRQSREQSLADAQQAIGAIREGRSLLFFAEGTLQNSPGLMPFKMGAFITAASTGVPIIPIAIRGTRSMLRGNTWYAYHGAISLVIGEPVYPGTARQGDSQTWPIALQLREQCRAHILQHCREPDLARQ
jgi:1-acyl-sn-glycerol-3-phosphate acyltransferase